MEIKNMIRTFCGCKPYTRKERKKENIEPHQNFTGSYKKSRGSGLPGRFTKYQEVKRW